VVMMCSWRWPYHDHIITRIL